MWLGPIKLDDSWQTFIVPPFPLFLLSPYCLTLAVFLIPLQNGSYCDAIFSYFSSVWFYVILLVVFRFVAFPFKLLLWACCKFITFFFLCLFIFFNLTFWIHLPKFETRLEIWCRHDQFPTVFPIRVRYIVNLLTVWSFVVFEKFLVYVQTSKCWI